MSADPESQIPPPQTIFVREDLTLLVTQGDVTIEVQLGPLDALRMVRDLTEIVVRNTEARRRSAGALLSVPAPGVMLS